MRFEPLTAVRWVRPVTTNRSRRSSGIADVSPTTSAGTRARASGHSGLQTSTSPRRSDPTRWFTASGSATTTGDSRARSSANRPEPASAAPNRTVARTVAPIGTAAQARPTSPAATTCTGAPLRHAPPRASTETSSAVPRHIPGRGPAGAHHRPAPETRTSTTPVARCAVSSVTGSDATAAARAAGLPPPRRRPPPSPFDARNQRRPPPRRDRHQSRHRGHHAQHARRSPGRREPHRRPCGGPERQHAAGAPVIRLAVQTRTCGSICSNVFWPMPSTSSNSSTRVKRPSAAPGEDRLRGHRAHAGEGVQLVERRGVEVEAVGAGPPPPADAAPEAAATRAPRRPVRPRRRPTTIWRRRPPGRRG